MAAAWLSFLKERPYRYFERIGSTQDAALSWAQAGAPEGAVVIANEQTAGRGRYDREWLAAPGTALLMSLITRPAIPPESLPRVTLMGAVALAQVLEEFGLKPGIKWPNDVQLGGRKVAGILAEAVWSGDVLGAVVLGLGINVRQGALAEDQARAFQATTIEVALGREVSRAEVLSRLLARLDDWRARLLDPALLDMWRSHSVTLGRDVTVSSGEETWTGVAEAVDEQGALLLRLEDGHYHRILAGDVTFIT